MTIPGSELNAQVKPSNGASEVLVTVRCWTIGKAFCCIARLTLAAYESATETGGIGVVLSMCGWPVWGLMGVGTDYAWAFASSANAAYAFSGPMAVRQSAFSVVRAGN